MCEFIPEDYLCISPHTAPVPLVFDPFADDFVLAKRALTGPQDAEETTTGCTFSMAKFVHRNFIKEVADSSKPSSSCMVDGTVEAQSVATQVPSEDWRTLNGAGLKGLISLPRSSLPRQLSEADTDTDSDTNDDGIQIPSGEAHGIPLSRSLAPAGVCIITAETARKIFIAKTKRVRSKKDGLACRLGNNFGISAKAVRDIWRLRTWAHATWPLWAPEDMTKHFKKKLCVSCRDAELTSIHEACMACKNKVPVGSKC